MARPSNGRRVRARMSSADRKSTRPELQSLRHLVCRLLLEKKKHCLLCQCPSFTGGDGSIVPLLDDSYPLSLHDALPIWRRPPPLPCRPGGVLAELILALTDEKEFVTRSKWRGPLTVAGFGPE